METGFISVSVRRHAYATKGIEASFQFESELLLDAYNTMLACQLPGQCLPLTIFARDFCVSVRFESQASSASSCHSMSTAIHRKTTVVFADLSQQQKTGAKTTVVARASAYFIFIHSVICSSLLNTHVRCSNYAERAQKKEIGEIRCRTKPEHRQIC